MKNLKWLLSLLLVLAFAITHCGSLSSNTTKHFSNNLDEVADKVEQSLVGLGMYVSELHEIDGPGYHFITMNQAARNQAGSGDTHQLTVLHIYVKTMADNSVEVRTHMPMTDHYASGRSDMMTRFFTNLNRQGLIEAGSDPS